MSKRFPVKTALLVAASLLASAGLGYGAVQQVPMGRAVDAAGVRTACAGVSIAARDEPRWRDYSVKFEAVGGYGQYLGDELLSVGKRSGSTIVRVSCEAPWVLMQLSPGRYSATMRIGDAEKRTRFTAPTIGQRDVIVRFPGRMAGKPIDRHLASNAQARANL